MPIDVTAGVQPLPRGTRLVHLGFHKSGTTALQEAFVDARKRLVEFHVAYPTQGAQRHHGKAALAVGDMHYGWKSAGIKYPEQVWTDLVTEVTGYGDQTVVVSSEHLAQLKPEIIQRVATELGPGPVHAVATVRPLEKILPSSWQQYVKGGLVMPYGKWLKRVLRNPPAGGPTPNFWRRHSHGDVIARWADIFGPENVTLVVVDDADRTMLFRSFEALLGLPPDTLLAAKRRDDNRSMTAAEAELVRRVSESVKSRGVDWDFFYTVIRTGLAQRMARERLPRPDEPRLSTPKWALERGAEIGTEAARQIEATGVRVIGDLSALGRYTGPPGPNRQPKQNSVPMGAAVEAVLGVMENYQKYARRTTNAMTQEIKAGKTPTVVRPPKMLQGRPIKDVSTKGLIKTLRARARAKVRRKVRQLRKMRRR
jgi:hypothetical protein